MRQKLLTTWTKGVFVILATVVCWSCVARGAVYDLKTDWSDSVNPNGVWTYRQWNTALPLQNDWWNNGSNQKAWALASYPAMDHVPVWMQIDTSMSDLVAGDITVHPTSHTSSSSPKAAANVIWTSPVDGTITISGGVWWGGWEGVDRCTDWGLYLNTQVLDFGTVGPGDAYDRSNPMPMNGGGVLAVHPGDIVQLMLSQIDRETYSWFTGVNLTINAEASTTPAVPVPSAVLLVGTGMAGLGGIRLRRRAAR